MAGQDQVQDGVAVAAHYSCGRKQSVAYARVTSGCRCSHEKREDVLYRPALFLSAIRYARSYICLYIVVI